MWLPMGLYIWLPSDGSMGGNNIAGAGVVVVVVVVVVVDIVIGDITSSGFCGEGVAKGFRKPLGMPGTLGMRGG